MQVSLAIATMEDLFDICNKEGVMATQDHFDTLSRPSLS